MKYYCGVIFIFLTTQSFFAQKQEKDSVYYRIERYSEKHKLTRYLYALAFREVPDTIQVSKYEKRHFNDSLKNKWVGNINISVIDPFGRDSNFKKEDASQIERLGNSIHIETKPSVIKDFLLFKEGDSVNQQKMYESERILRAQRFINRAQILPVLADSLKSDSIDVNVTVLDRWSLLPRFSISGSRFIIGLTDENFLGYGHQLDFRYGRNFKKATNYFSGGYYISNIKKTFISARLSAEKDFDLNENYNLEFNRTFFSVFTKWSGGIRLNQFRRKVSVPTSISQEIFTDYNIKVFSQDFWGGYQLPVFNKKHERVSDNLAIGARYINFDYLNQPDEIADPNSFFVPYQMLLASVGYSSRKYQVHHNVFQYNYLEDIPYGKILTLTGGMLKQNGESLPYLGMSVGYGTFFKSNYFSFNLQYGTFYNEPKGYRSTIRVDGVYFSPLIKKRFGDIRHFISPTILIGNKRNNTYSNRNNFNASDEFPPFDANYYGKDKFIEVIT